MKDYLSGRGTWLGGEFYAATGTEIVSAWRNGREAALACNPSY
ncbi:MAG: hypothetical protein QOI12_5228 [Alphaproteobacteria bacterium]|jgi:hypothetical protein|nr:hypothetical protein [Alphaproteobacteria bacterium]